MRLVFWTVRMSSRDSNLTSVDAVGAKATPEAAAAAAAAQAKACIRIRVAKMLKGWRAVDLRHLATVLCQFTWQADYAASAKAFSASSLPPPALRSPLCHRMFALFTKVA